MYSAELPLKTFSAAPLLVPAPLLEEEKWVCCEDDMRRWTCEKVEGEGKA
jgi:hypothetical protein|tara:strand:- start:20083 stop:20232 length:150 start_codon:yes stop_codon:yes gene_type:complete